MRKKLLSIIMTIAMVFQMEMPAYFVSAAESLTQTKTPVTTESPAPAAATVDVSTSGLDLSTLPAERTEYTAGTGTIVFEPSAGQGQPHTLTFTDAVINNPGGYAVKMLVAGDYKIVLNGASTLSSASTNSWLCDADAGKVNLTFEKGTVGAGTLVFQTYNNRGLYVNGSVTINGGEITAAKNTESIYAIDSVNFAGGKFTGTNVYASNGALTISGKAAVNLTVQPGNQAITMGSGTPDITMTGGTLNVIGDIKLDNYNFPKDFNISGGTVILKGALVDGSSIPSLSGGSWYQFDTAGKTMKGFGAMKGADVNLTGVEEVYFTNAHLLSMDEAFKAALKGKTLYYYSGFPEDQIYRPEGSVIKFGNPTDGYTVYGPSADAGLDLSAGLPTEATRYPMGNDLNKYIGVDPATSTINLYEVNINAADCGIKLPEGSYTINLALPATIKAVNSAISVGNGSLTFTGAYTLEAASENGSVLDCGSIALQDTTRLNLTGDLDDSKIVMGAHNNYWHLSANKQKLFVKGNVSFYTGDVAGLASLMISPDSVLWIDDNVPLQEFHKIAITNGGTIVYPAGTSYADAKSYGGKVMIDDMAFGGDITTDGLQTEPAQTTIYTTKDGGTVKYDKENSRLTLTNATLNIPNGTPVFGFEKPQMTVVLNGQNSCTGTGELWKFADTTVVIEEGEVTGVLNAGGRTLGTTVQKLTVDGGTSSKPINMSVDSLNLAENAVVELKNAALDVTQNIQCSGITISGIAMLSAANIAAPVSIKTTESVTVFVDGTLDSLYVLGGYGSDSTRIRAGKITKKTDDGMASWYGAAEVHETSTGLRYLGRNTTLNGQVNPDVGYTPLDGAKTLVVGQDVVVTVETGANADALTEIKLLGEGPNAAQLKIGAGQEFNIAHTNGLTVTGTMQNDGVIKFPDGTTAEKIVNVPGKFAISATTYGGDISNGCEWTTLPAEKTTYLAGGGVATFDPSVNTLTLTGAAINGLMNFGGSDVNIVLEGDNTVSGSVENAAVICANSINISGTGTLNVENKNTAAGGNAIHTTGNLTISGTVNATAKYDWAISADGNITVSGSGKVTAKNDSEGRAAVYTSGSLTVEKGATVNATSTKGNAIFANSNITVSGKVTAKNEVSNNSTLYAAGSLTVAKDAHLTLTATNTNKDTGEALYFSSSDIKGTLELTGNCSGELTVTGGTVTAKQKVFYSVIVNSGSFATAEGVDFAGSATVNGGTMTVNGDITVSDFNDSTVTINGGTVSVTGNITGGTVTIDGGTLKADGTAAEGTLTKTRGFYTHGKTTEAFGGAILPNGLTVNAGEKLIVLNDTLYIWDDQVLTIAEGGEMRLYPNAKFDLSMSGDLVNNGTVHLYPGSDNWNQGTVVHHYKVLIIDGGCGMRENHLEKIGGVCYVADNTDITFKAVPKDDFGHWLQNVTYRVGSEADVPLTPDTNGVYTVPAEAVTGDLTITLGYTDLGNVTAPTANTLTYNYGNQALVTAVTPSEGFTYEYTLDAASGSWSKTIPTGKKAGEYKVYYRVTNAHGVIVDGDAPVTVKIKQAPASVSAPIANTLTYNREAQALITAPDAVNCGELQYKLGTGDWQTEIPTGTNAGEYEVYYKIVPDANHTAYEPADPVTVTISPKTVENPTIEPTFGSTVYTGSPITASSVIVKDRDNVIDGSEYSVDYKNNINVADASKIVIKDNLNGNYIVTGELEFDIIKADYNMDGITFADSTVKFNRVEHGIEIGGTLPTGADSIPVTVSYECTTNRTDVGSHEITAKFATTSTNYNVPEAMKAKITITRAELTADMFTAGNLTHTYDGSEKQPTITLMPQYQNSGVGAVTVNTKGTNVEDSKNVVSFSVAEGANYNAANLTIAQAFAIQKADPTKEMFTVSGNTHNYDGNEHTAVVEANTGIVGMGVVTVNTKATNVADSKAIKISVAEGDNYKAATLTLDETLTIKPIDPTADMFTVASNVYTYNGAEHKPTVTVKDTISGMGEITVNTKGTNVADSKVIEISVAKGANYNAKTIALGEKLTINAKPITGAIVELSNTLKYNGKTLTQNVQSVTIDGMTATYTVNNNTGKDAGKYNMTITGNGNFTGEITQEFTIAQHDALALAAEIALVCKVPNYEQSLTLSGISGYPADAGTGPVLALGTQNLGENTTATLTDGVLKLVANSTTANTDGSVVINLTGMKNYANSKITVTVNYTDKTPVTISGISVVDREYNGKPFSYTGTPAAMDADQVVKPSGYTYTWKNSDGTVLSSAPVNAGTYQLVVAVKDTDTQYIGSVTVPFTISKKNVTAPAQAAAVTYNGKAQTYAVTSTEDYTVTADAQTNANETGYDVTIALKDEANTQWADGKTADLSHKFIIKKAVVTVTAENKSAHIGSTQPANTYKVTGLIGEDQLTGTVTFTDNADMNTAGSYSITPAGGDAGANYTIQYKASTLTVEDHSWNTEWSKNETNHWHECSACHAHKDEAVHTWKAPEFVFAADGKTATAKTSCACGQLHEEAAAMTSEITTPATCTLMGTTTYTAKVTLNGTEYTETTTRQDVAIDPSNHNNQIAKVDAKAATCTENGNQEYYQCAGCGKLYSDVGGLTEITLEEVTIKATGHKWGEPVITFAEDGKTATAVVTCETDKTHTHKLDAKVTPQVKTPATKETMGITTYTATLSFEGKTYTASKDVQDIPKVKPAETVEKVETNQLTEVPESLKDTPYNTVEKIEQAMEEVVLNKIGEQNTGNEQKTTVFDAVLMITENGVTRPATKEEVEARGGITIVIPYPAGTNGTDFVFTVAHMLTMDMAGMQAGDIETPEITLTDTGLKVTLKGLSPVMVGYSKKAAPTEPTVPETIAPVEPNTPATGDSYAPFVLAAVTILAAGAAGLILAERKKREYR